MADYIWPKLAAPGEDVLEVDRKRYQREDVAFSNQNCNLAEADDGIVGLLVAFPMHLDSNAKAETGPVLVP